MFTLSIIICTQSVFLCLFRWLYLGNRTIFQVTCFFRYNILRVVKQFVNFIINPSLAYLALTFTQDNFLFWFVFMQTHKYSQCYAARAYLFTRPYHAFTPNLRKNSFFLCKSVKVLTFCCSSSLIARGRC